MQQRFMANLDRLSGRTLAPTARPQEPLPLLAQRCRLKGGQSAVQRRYGSALRPPEGQEGNWVQTMPGKGWNTLFRLYAPLQPWFNKSWKLGDFEPVQ